MTRRRGGFTPPGDKDMNSIVKRKARFSVDIAEGHLIATTELAAPPERVFRALASKEIINWWIRAGVFDTREWAGDVRAGGRWRASGVARGQPYELEGEFLEIDPPRKLVHTWHRVGTQNPPTTVTYDLDRLDGGTRVTLRHAGFTSPETCTNTAIGWETSFERLAECLAL
jgi:uncharacterized protein YndB with AHSA1/START domain